MTGEEASLRVLLVSQDESTIEDVRFGFPAGADIRVERDATVARTALESFTPSVVIVEQMTGNSGGLALTKDMRQSPRLAGIPILVLLERDQDAWLAKQAGATLLRTKPVTAESLAAAALSLLS